VPYLDAGLSEIARFLSHRPPFEALAPEELGEVVRETQVEFFVAGESILSEEGGPVTFLRVIYSGAVDFVHEDMLLDLLGPGDSFGHAAMLSGLPPGFEARAAEDTLCYRIPAAVARPLLECAYRRELAVGVHEPGHQPVARLIRTPTVICDPHTPIAEVARRMTEAGTSAAVVDRDGELGIVTDKDLRQRVVAARISPNGPVEAVMTMPAYTVPPGRLGGEVLFEMLERGIQHAPVVSERGRLVGVVEDADLFAVQPRSWFGTRRTIARAHDLEALTAVARRLPEIVLDLQRSNLRALEVARVLSALTDALTERAIDLAFPSERLPADGIVCVAVGSQARRELTLASVPRCAVVCTEPPPDGWAEAVGAALSSCGISWAPMTRSPAAWIAALDEGELAQAMLAERRAVWGTPREPLPIAPDGAREHLVDLLRRRALETAPPTGFDESGVLEAGGGRSDLLDIRGAVVAPIVEIARWGGVVAGTIEGSTPDRLAAAAVAGVIAAADARTLIESFELAHELRVEHHVKRLEAGSKVDDLLDPAAMTPLARAQLRDVFHAVTAFQRRWKQ
jgi:CBS domain-containing protein